MSLGQRVAVFVIGGLLLLSLGGANMAMTAERTALNADYVSNTLQSEGVYQEVAEETKSEVVEDLSAVQPGQSDELPSEIDLGVLDREAIAEQAISERYIANQTKSNLRSLYAYLHGETTQLNLVIDTRPLKENLAAAIGQQATDIDLEALFEEAGNFDQAPVPVDDDLVPRMLESASSFDRVKQDFRENVRAEVRRETGASGAELDRQVQEALDRMAQTTKSRIESTARQQMAPFSENVTNATIEMHFAVVDALATDTGYAAFSSRMDRAKRQLGQEAGRLAIQQMDAEVDDRVDLSEYVDGNVENQLKEGSTVVQRIDTLSLAMPIAALLLIAVAYGVTRSLHQTSKMTGSALVVAGLLGMFVAFVLSNTILQFARDAFETERATVSDAVIDLVDGVLGTLGSQSMLLAGTGLVLYGLVFADKRGFLDGIKAQAAATTGIGDPSAYRSSRAGQRPVQNRGQPQGARPGQPQNAGQQPHNQGQQPGRQPQNADQQPGQQPHNQGQQPRNQGMPPGQQGPSGTGSQSADQQDQSIEQTATQERPDSEQSGAPDSSGAEDDTGEESRTDESRTDESRTDESRTDE